MFGNRVLRRIFGPKRAEVTGDRRKLHEPHNFFSLTNRPTIRVNKAGRIRWARRVAYMGEMFTALQLKDLKGRDHLRDLDIDGKINIEMYLISCETMDWNNIYQHGV
jgi:hypothetical protein